MHPMTQEFFNAVQNNNITSVTTLLENNKVDINTQNAEGETALFSAARASNIPMMELLLNKGIGIDYYADSLYGKMTALTQFIVDPLAISNEETLNTINFLLQHGAQEGLTDTFLWVAEKGDENLVNFLLKERGVNINVTNNVGQNALFGAACEAQFSMMELLLKEGININHQCHKNFTALSYCVQILGTDESLVSIVSFLSQKGARKGLNESLIWIAQSSQARPDSPNMLSLIQTLLYAGADLSAKNQSGITAFKLLPEMLREKVALLKTREFRTNYKIPETIHDDLLIVFLKQFQIKEQENKIKTKLFLLNTLSPKPFKEIENQSNSLIQFLMQLFYSPKKISNFSQWPQHMLDTIILMVAQDLIKEEYNIEASLADMRKLKALPSYFREPEASTDLTPRPR